MEFIGENSVFSHLTYHRTSLWTMHGVSYGVECCTAPLFLGAGVSSQGSPAASPKVPPRWFFFNLRTSLCPFLLLRNAFVRKEGGSNLCGSPSPSSWDIPTHFGAGHLVATTSMGSAPSGVRRPSPHTQGLWGRPCLFVVCGACITYCSGAV